MSGKLAKAEEAVHAVMDSVDALRDPERERTDAELIREIVFLFGMRGDIFPILCPTLRRSRFPLRFRDTHGFLWTVQSRSEGKDRLENALLVGCDRGYTFLTKMKQRLPLDFILSHTYDIILRQLGDVNARYSEVMGITEYSIWCDVKKMYKDLEGVEGVPETLRPWSTVMPDPSVPSTFPLEVLKKHAQVLQDLVDTISGTPEDGLPTWWPRT
jgi:hypothetical protein